MKQAIIIRKDLNLGKGKMAAQASHASLNAYKKASFTNKNIWEMQGQKKVVLKIDSEKEMIALFNKADAEKMKPALIRDAGRTEIPSGTITALAIGPDRDEKIDKITGHLKLY
ncbi:MAG: peptidyl-tRNA hydrolase Pth2 [Candidatus Aenigmarchaeota archaeon]|nr:peptidyl-tRNA hydrolase Pth2 [Candidatus Aenigmarchaeota archaeon]